MLFTVILKIHLAQKMELNCEHFRAIIFYNFRRGLTQQQFLAMKLHQGPVFIGLSTEVMVQPKTNCVKVVQN